LERASRIGLTSITLLASKPDPHRRGKTEPRALASAFRRVPCSLGHTYYCACRSFIFAQDPFEIQVFEYEPLPLGAYTCEAAKSDGPVAPEQDQFHASSEWTAGITDQIRAGL
jgi:hypothetical protein